MLYVAEFSKEYRCVIIGTTLFRLKFHKNRTKTVVPYITHKPSVFHKGQLFLYIFLFYHVMMPFASASVRAYLNELTLRVMNCCLGHHDFSCCALHELNCLFSQCALAQFMAQPIHELQLNYSFSAQVRQSPLVIRTTFATANRRGAICGIRSDKRASRCELP